MDKLLRLDNSGGLRSELFSVFGPNESDRLMNLYCHTGPLRAMEGSIPWASERMDSAIDDGAVWSLGEYHDGNTLYVVAAAGSGLFIGCVYAMRIDSVGAGTITIWADDWDDGVPSQGWMLYRDNIIQYDSKDDATHTIAATGNADDQDQYVYIIDWKPIAGVVEDAGPSVVQPGVSARVSMKQVGTDLFFAPNDFDSSASSSLYSTLLFAWSGFHYCTGRVACAGTTSVTSEAAADITAPDFVTAGVKPGDIIFFRTGGDAFGDGDWQMEDGRIISEVAETTLTLTLAGPDTTGDGWDGTSNYCDYVIVRTSQAGIMAGGTCTATQTGLASSIDTGQWKFFFRYKDSVSGRVGNQSVESSVVTISATNQNIRVSGWTTPNQVNIDTVEVYANYRVDANGAWTGWALIGSISRTGASWAFPSSYWDIDTLATSSLTPIVDNTEWGEAYTQPGQVTGLVWFNNRLWARGMYDERHYLKGSTFGSPHHWPGITSWHGDPDDYNVYYGLDVQLGSHAGDPIVAMVPEGGTFANTGNVGTNLLIFFRDRAVRWYGQDWSDFVYTEALGDGCIADGSVQNKGGMIYWLDDDGPRRMPSGGSVSERFGLGVWPYGVADLLPKVRTRNLVQVLPWQSASWKNFYVLTAQDEDGDWSVYLYDVETGSWTTHSTACASVLAPADGELYGGLSERRLVAKLMEGSWLGMTDGEDDGYAARIVEARDSIQPYYKISSMPIQQRTGPYWFKELDRAQKIGKVVVAVRKCSAAQTLDLKIYVDGSDTAVYDSSVSGHTRTVAAGDPTEREYLSWFPPQPRGAMVQFEIVSSLTRQTTIDWLTVESALSSHVRNV